MNRFLHSEIIDLDVADVPDVPTVLGESISLAQFDVLSSTGEQIPPEQENEMAVQANLLSVIGAPLDDIPIGYLLISTFR